jgi:hypothetical protein
MLSQLALHGTRRRAGRDGERMPEANGLTPTNPLLYKEIRPLGLDGRHLETAWHALCCVEATAPRAHRARPARTVLHLTDVLGKGPALRSSPRLATAMRGERDSTTRLAIQGRRSPPLWHVSLPAPARRGLCCLPILAFPWMTIPPSPAHAVQSESRVELISAIVGRGHADSLPLSAARERMDAATPMMHVTMVPQLADNLALLFDKFGESEFVVCIEGALGDADSLQLSDSRIPHHAYSSSTSAGVYPAGD